MQTGDVSATFSRASADFTDWVRIVDTTQLWSSQWLFNNHPPDLQQPVVFGGVTVGDNLVVQVCVVPIWEHDGLCKDNDSIYASDPALSDDGVNHAYLYQLSQGLAFIGLEDLQQNKASDWDYNNLEFQLSSVTVSFPNGPVAALQPSSLILLASGIIAGLKRIPE